MDVSASGSLAYVPGAAGVAERELVWLDRRGAATLAVSDKRAYKGAQLSPDGRIARRPDRRAVDDEPLELQPRRAARGTA